MLVFVLSSLEAGTLRPLLGAALWTLAGFHFPGCGVCSEECVFVCACVCSVFVCVCTVHIHLLAGVNCKYVYMYRYLYMY